MVDGWVGGCGCVVVVVGGGGGRILVSARVDRWIPGSRGKNGWIPGSSRCKWPGYPALDDSRFLAVDFRISGFGFLVLGWIPGSKLQRIPLGTKPMCG